jgi:hypothetical protein
VAAQVAGLGVGPVPPATRLDVTARVEREADTGRPRRVTGQLTIRDWRPESGALCVYLPYLDSTYGADLATNRRFEMFTDKRGRQVFEGGATTVAPTVLEQVRLVPTLLPQIMRVEPQSGWQAGDELTLAFDSTVPRLPSSNDSDWFYEGFYPQPLSRCDDEQWARRIAGGIPPGILPVPAQIHADLTFPEGYKYAGPGPAPTGTHAVADVSGRGLGFALATGLRHERRTIGKVDVELAYRSEGFDRLWPTVERALGRLTTMLGAFPQSHLVIVETTELQRQGLPGIIAVNKPSQLIFERAQSTWLNWRHWVVAAQLARQWYGAVVVAPRPEDDWMITGLAEFATLEALRGDGERFDLFNPTEGGLRLLSFDYLQTLEISAATLRRYAPFSALTDAEFETRESYSQQHPLLFVKHAIAMRQMQAYAGEVPFDGFMRTLTATHAHKSLSPAEFARFLDRMPSPFAPAVRRQLAESLRRWWVDEGWPDFALEDFDVEELANGRFVSHVKATQDGRIDFAPVIGVRDRTGRTTYARATRPKGETQGPWSAEIVTRERPVAATVDPTHEAFDADRFDNTTEWPGVFFFPGSANTLRDDAYTVGWAPYAFRRPGEPFSYGITGAGFRYTQGGLFFHADWAPSEKLTAYQLRQRYEIPARAIHGDLTLEKSYDRDFLAEASILRSPVFPGPVALSLVLKLRHRQRAGERLSQHQTGAVGFSLKPSGMAQTCGYNLGAEIERAPESLAHGFEYERKLGAVAGDCNAGDSRVNLALRVFGGSLYRKGVVPEAALFKPNDLKEARIRIDRGLGGVEQIAAFGADLLLPFYVPLPSDTLILARQLRWKVFYDAGHAARPFHDYRSAGGGVLLPFGGDLTGAGSLSLTRLTVLGIFYSSLDGDVSRKPSIVFDLTGEL